MTKLEEIARAAYEDFIQDVRDLEPSWEALPQSHRDRMIRAQIAALKAMREPTEAMVEAAEGLDDQGSSVYGDPFVACPHDDAWRAMIDAIIQERQA